MFSSYGQVGKDNIFKAAKPSHLLQPRGFHVFLLTFNSEINAIFLFRL